MIDPAQLTCDLGGTWRGHYGTAPCPCCQPERRRDQTALSVRADGDRLLLHCKKLGCDFRDILVASGIAPGRVEIGRKAVCEAQQKQREQEAKNLAKARAFWRQGQPIANTLGAQYLRGRGITCALPGALRWVESTYHAPSGKQGGAIVANILSAKGEAMGIHRTFLTKQGQRLPRDAKMMLGKSKGGAVELTTGAGPLVICEGIETGLSLASGLLRGPATVWAALSTAGMVGLSLPRDPGKLVIASDGDDAGRIASEKLATRAAGLGWQVSLLTAPQGRDWNDVLVGAEAPA